MKHPKYAIPVKIMVDDGTKHFGCLYLRQDQRVLDVINDDRAFLPFRMRERTILLNKTRISQVDLLSIDEVIQMESVLPEIDLDYLRANSW